jgi:hypothetical protein
MQSALSGQLAHSMTDDVPEHQVWLSLKAGGLVWCRINAL